MTRTLPLLIAGLFAGSAQAQDVVIVATGVVEDTSLGSPIAIGEEVTMLFAYDPMDAEMMTGKLTTYDFDPGELVFELLANGGSWTIDDAAQVAVGDDVPEQGSEADVLIFENTGARGTRAGAPDGYGLFVQDTKLPPALLSSDELPDSPEDVDFEEATDAVFGFSNSGSPLAGGFFIEGRVTALTVEAPTPVTSRSWGAIKRAYR